MPRSGFTVIHNFLENGPERGVCFFEVVASAAKGKCDEEYGN